MKRWLAIGALFVSPALGARELHWRDFAVHARLDAGGRLHVEETQVMVFTGDWNGGYREFRLAPGQKLELDGLERVDEPSGRRIPLVEGDVSLVDHYEWSDAKTLRWRSRLPFDPAFDNTALTYVLSYTLSNILGRSGDTYVLDHDFAFPNRTGVIERFTLALDLDPAWQPPPGFETRLERHNVPSGSGIVIRTDLRYRGAGPPPAAPRTFTGRDRRIVLAGIAGLFVLLLLRHRWWESAAGRYRGLVPPSAITPEWLKENLFVWKPEEAGAAWDDAIGAPEVAATLARLVAEGKLESRIETKAEALGSKGHVLHLKLKAPRDRFAAGYERDLIEKIFVEGEEMDTDTLRKHYASTGFDPSKILTEPLQKRIAADMGQPRKAPAWEKLPAWLLTLAGLGLAVWTFLASPAARGLAVAAIVAFAFAGVAGAVAGAAVSAAWKRHYGPSTDELLPLFLIPPILFFAPAALLDLAHRAHFGAFAQTPEWLVLALLCLGLSGMIGAFLSARTTDPPNLLERRRTLASARQFFEAELGKREPALVDAWYPYLVAFGLDKKVAGWFHAYGAGAAGTSFSGSGASPSVSSSSWSGGGGAFGGAGASAGWAAAAAGIAGGVAAPSSSSGGGGGGGSSGGGGGGGW